MFSICKNTHKVWYKNHRIWHGSRNLMIFDLLTSTQGHQFDPRMKILLAFRLPCQFQRFLYQTLCVFSQIKYRRHIESVARVMPQGWDLWVLADQNFSVGICHGAPLTARSSHCCYQCRYMYEGWSESSRKSAIKSHCFYRLQWKFIDRNYHP